ncbi:MAG: four helix bundle protein [Planctomycetes bacterium]|nr:four helix bundle protein [Planctomycetota bacterium]
MDKTELERRTKEFAIRIARFVDSLPNKKSTNAIGYQLVKSGTSIGANYREANRTESHDDFIHKIGIVEKEAGETQYWLEICEGIHTGETNERNWLSKECSELLAIFTTIGKTAKQRRRDKGKG